MTSTITVYMRPNMPQLLHLPGTKATTKTLCKHYPLKKLEQRDWPTDWPARWCTDCFMAAARPGVIRGS